MQYLGYGLLHVRYQLKRWWWHYNLCTGFHPQFFVIVLFRLSGLLIGPSLMSISLPFLELWQFSFIRSFTRNLRMGNTPVWVLSNIWWLEHVMDTGFVTSVSNLVLQNVWFTAFTISELLRENQLEREVKNTQHPQPDYG